MGLGFTFNLRGEKEGRKDGRKKSRAREDDGILELRAGFLIVNETEIYIRIVIASPTAAAAAVTIF